MVERALRLRREAEVRQARSRGKPFADGPLVARVLPNKLDPPQNRYTVIAGKKAGKAVQRNRCKRLVREALRRLHPRLRPGHDVVIVVRGTVEELTGLAVAEASLGRIVRRADLLLPPPDAPGPISASAGAAPSAGPLPEPAPRPDRAPRGPATSPVGDDHDRTEGPA